MEQKVNNLQKALNRVSNVIEDSGTRGITVQEISYRLSMNLHAVKTQVGVLKKAGKITQQGNICKWVEEDAPLNISTPEKILQSFSLEPSEPVYFTGGTHVNPKKWLTFNLYKEEDVRSK